MRLGFGERAEQGAAGSALALVCFQCLIGPRSFPTTLICGRYFCASFLFTLTVLLQAIVTQQLKYLFINNALRSIYIVRVQLAGCWVFKPLLLYLGEKQLSID